MKDFVDFLAAHKAAIAVAVTWVWSRARTSLPALGTPLFWRTWLYDFMKGNSAQIKPLKEANDETVSTGLRLPVPSDGPPRMP